MSTKSSTPHGRGVRGFNLPRSSLLFEGNFGRLFRALPVAEFGSDDEETRKNLSYLADALIGDEETSEDGPDDEESGIPALYTYLGQFIDHDLTFDPSSSLQQQNDIDGLVNYRTPRFDLDNIYGRGPDDQPYMYVSETGKKAAKFLLGTELTGGSEMNPPAADLPRNTGANPARAIIGDPRNDENVIVSQLQSLFFRFHNRFVDENPEMPFTKVQREVRFHYQWMLINDFLPTIIYPDVYKKVFPHYGKAESDGTPVSIADAPPELKFYHAKHEPFMPFEFSAAAYRFGHSMVRPGYRLNDDDSTLLPIFGLPHSLRGFMPPQKNWGIDWARFIDIEDRPNGETPAKTPEQEEINRRRLQLAYRIDTSIVKPLSALPEDVADKIIKSLAERNLVRGWRLRLPSGQ
ncbi:MAG TPA: peroxidase family protein, partial [Pyrinomonadaceae bacterium]